MDLTARAASRHALRVTDRPLALTFSATGLNGYPGSTWPVFLRVVSGGAISEADQTWIDITQRGPQHPAILAFLPSRSPWGPPSLSWGGFTDPGIPDTHTATWTFTAVTIPGPITADGLVSESEGAGTAQVTLAFSTPGVYHVLLTVTDDDGDSDTATTYEVWTPFRRLRSVGWLRHRWRLDYVARGCGSCSTLRPRARRTSALSRKYKKGATTPTGQTEFQFQAANLNFHSASYDWLVVAGARPSIRAWAPSTAPGTTALCSRPSMATVNGGAGVDKFRIKIWG